MTFINRLKSKIDSIIIGNKRESSIPVKSIQYKGVEVFYSEGTSLIKRILDTGAYEPEVVIAITRNVKKNISPVILDIGSNIGLISIAILQDIPSAKIFAFEPGPHQNGLFQQTIQQNKLEQKIILSNLALSNQKDVVSFRVHDSSDVSGDGFIDTQRAGKTKKIKVVTETLDNWWNTNEKPKIDFIKMDTEGSEYWILEGATEMIRQIKPDMLIEINPQNIKNYPFKIEDLLLKIKELGYKIYDLNDCYIPFEKMSDAVKTTDTFLLKQ